MATPNAHALRREADLVRLQQLVSEAAGRIRILEASPRPGQPIRLAIRCRTVESNAGVGASNAECRLRIDLPARYPFERPVLTIESRIFHPNVFPSGVICQGDKWLAGDGLDVLLKRIIRLIIFDPGHVNPASAANRLAASWYLEQRRRSPELFPTDRLMFTEPAGPAAATRVVRSCPACGTGLRLPTGRRGIVACPSCRHEFEAST